MVRTSDGILHLATVQVPNGDIDGLPDIAHVFTFAIGADGAQTARTQVVHDWWALQQQPRLTSDAEQVMLVYNGFREDNYTDGGGRYLATSADGVSWVQQPGSLSHYDGFGWDLGVAAATKADGTIVTAQPVKREEEPRPSFLAHVGHSPASDPAAEPDLRFTLGSGPGQFSDPTLVRDGNGAVWIAGHVAADNADDGVWLQRILPTPGKPLRPARAPDAAIPPGSEVVAGPSPLPGQEIAMVTRPGGDVWVVSCAGPAADGPTDGDQPPCAFVQAWRVGTDQALVVPGSAGGRARHVAASTDPDGRLVVAWYDAVAEDVKLVRSIPTATGWGPIRAVQAPEYFGQAIGLWVSAGDDSADVVMNARRVYNGGYPMQFLRVHLTW